MPPKVERRSGFFDVSRKLKLFRVLYTYPSTPTMDSMPDPTPDPPLDTPIQPPRYASTPWSDRAVSQSLPPPPPPPLSISISTPSSISRTSTPTVLSSIEAPAPSRTQRPARRLARRLAQRDDDGVRVELI